jgi:hypothetical protein
MTQLDVVILFVLLLALVAIIWAAIRTRDRV